MSVKIEILDYARGSGENEVNLSNGSPSSDWQLVNDTSADFTGDGTNGVRYFENISIPLVAGQEYFIRMEIINFSGTNNVGFSKTNSGTSTANGITNNARFNDNIIIRETFTCIASGTPRIFSRGTNNCTVKNILIRNTNGIDWENSVVGELDVTDTDDFPLAMTFQVSDFKDLTKTTGDYSKSFEVPATKNNNLLLKHLYIANIKVDNDITSKKKCRIIFNNLFSLSGLIQVTGVKGFGDNPQSYSCVFYGNNVGWASAIEGKRMNDIDWGNEGLDLNYNKTNIISTWDDVDCDTSTSHIVYPVVSYGDYNPEGDQRTIQLLDTAFGYNGTGSSTKVGYYGYFNGSDTPGSYPVDQGTGFGNNYNTPVPSSDWRPAIFVKNTIKAIFDGIGYRIISNFMDTDLFKKLVWSLPNFQYNNSDQRYLDFSVHSELENGQTGTAPNFSGDTGIQQFSEGSLSQSDDNFFLNEGGREIFDMVTASAGQNFKVTLDDGNYVDSTNNHIVIGEYGFYDLSLLGVEARISQVYKGGSVVKNFNSIGTATNIEVQTAGQSSWNIISTAFGNIPSPNGVSSTTFARTDPFPVNDNETKMQWLNKGDKIRITFGISVLAPSGNNTQNFIVYVMFSAQSRGQFKIKFISHKVEFGQTYDLNKVMNPDSYQVDFIKGVAHAFNLNMTTDEGNKTIKIEPFDDFYKGYKDAIDWTYKLDRTKDVNDEWLRTNIKRNLVFKYKTDSSDAVVIRRGKDYFKGVEDEFPYLETLPPSFEKGESEYENPFFAGSYNAKDQDTRGPLVTGNQDVPFSACLWTEITSPNDFNRPDKGYNFLPRLLYWNRYTSQAVNTPKKSIVQTWSGVNETIAASSNANNNYLSGFYPQATMIDRDKTSSPVLSYGNSDIANYVDDTNSYESSVSAKGLYQTYYRKMFGMLTDNPRLRIAYFSLKITDIVNLDFTRLIYLDGVYWRINRIIDYIPNQNTSTKVELIEWIEQGAFAAGAPTFGAGGETAGWGEPVIDDQFWGF